MTLEFPQAPTLGQRTTTVGRTYQWNGSAWDLVGSGIAGPPGPLGPTGPNGGVYVDVPSDDIIYGRRNGSWVDLSEPANLQVNRGTAAEVAAYTPLAGEPVWEETTKSLFYGDGATQGGILVGRRVVVSAAVESTLIDSGTYSTPIAVSLVGTGSLWRVFGQLQLIAIDTPDADVELNLLPSGGTIRQGALFISAPAGFAYKTAYRDASTVIALAQNELAAVSVDYVVQLTSSTWSFGIPLRRTAGTLASYYENTSFLYAERLL